MGEKGAIVDAFVDRTEELAALEEQFADHQAAMVVIYGRRRIGKTALITEFVRDKRALYFLATEESEEQNRAAFQKQVAAFTGDELLGQVSVDNWDVLFDRLTSDGERLVVALDEFQYLGKANPAFPSVFQRIWDTMLSKRNVMVILCGSLISLMESQVLSYSSPLYGRRTAQVRMKQIPFRFYRDFFSKEIGRRELVELYSVTGGVPKYIESFRGVDDVYRGIEKSVLNSSSYLYDEPNFLLSKEVSEVGTYFSILKAVAAGNRKSGEIAAALNVRQTGLSKYLKVLERLDVLERVVPVTEENPEKSKKGLYRIKDNYLRFWFRFVFPQMGLLETGRRAEEQLRRRAGRLRVRGRVPRPPVGCGRGRGAPLHARAGGRLVGRTRCGAGRCGAGRRRGPSGVRRVQVLGEARGRQCAEALGRAGSKGPGRPLFSALWRPARLCPLQYRRVYR